MIDYFKELFNKPKYMWTSLDDLAITGLVLGFIIIVGLIWIGVWLILELRKKHKYNVCERIKANNNICWNCNDCLGCGFYKKKKNSDFKK